MKKPRLQEGEELTLVIMNKIDEYDVMEKWQNEVLSHYDRSTYTYTGIHNAEDFICEKYKELDAWLEGLLDDVSGIFIDDVIKMYFGSMFIGEEYAYWLANDEGALIGDDCKIF